MDPLNDHAVEVAQTRARIQAGANPFPLMQMVDEQAKKAEGGGIGDPRLSISGEKGGPPTGEPGPLEAFSQAMEAPKRGINAGIERVLGAKSVDEAVQGLRDVVMGVASYPTVLGTAPMAAIHAAVKSKWPEALKAEVLPNGSVLRTMMGGGPRKVSDQDYAAMTPEEQQKYQADITAHNAPMNVEELSTAMAGLAPLLGIAGAGSKAGEAAGGLAKEALASERGSIGQPPPETPVPAEGTPAGQPVGEPAKLNTAHLQTTPNVKELLGKLVDWQQAEIAKQFPRTTFEEQRAKAQQVLTEGTMTAEKILKTEPGDPIWTGPEIDAAAQIMTRLGNTVRDMAQDPAVPDEDLLQHAVMAGAVAKQVLGQRRLYAQTMAGFRKELGPASTEPPAFTPEALASLVEQYTAKGVNGNTIRSILNELPTEAARTQFMTSLVGRVTDNVLEYLYGAVLSGPPTHARYTLSHMVMNVMGPIQRYAQAAIPGSGVSFGEANHLVLGMSKAVMDGIRLFDPRKFGTSFKKDFADAVQRNLSQGEWDRAPSITAEDWHVANIPLLNHVVDGFGVLVRTPSKALSINRAAQRALNASGQKMALAYREAQKLGGTAQEIADNTAKLYDEPTEQMQSDMATYTDRQTFTGGEYDLAPQLLKKAEAVAMTRTGRLLGTLFFRTPVHVTESYLRLVPFGNLLLKSTWEDLTSGDAVKVSRVAAETGVAMGMFYGFTQLADAGYITGSYPTDPKEKAAWIEAGIPEHSIRLNKEGTKWVSSSMIAPLDGWLGAAADFSRAWAHQAGTSLAEAVPGFALTLAKSEIGNIPIWRYAKGIGGAMNAIVEGFTEDKAKGIKGYFENLLQEFNPAIMRDIARSTDNEKRLAVFAKDRASSPWAAEIQYMWDRFKQNTPGLSKTLPSELDPISGDVKLDDTPMRWINPTKQTDRGRVYSRVKDELVNQHVSVFVPQFVPGAFLKKPEPPSMSIVPEPEPVAGPALTAKEQHDLVDIATHKIKALGGRTLEDALAHTMDTPQYKNLKDATTEGPTPGMGGKGPELQKIISAYYHLAMQQLLHENPELDNLVRARIEQGANQQTPQNAPPLVIPRRQVPVPAQSQEPVTGSQVTPTGRQ